MTTEFIEAMRQVLIEKGLEVSRENLIIELRERANTSIEAKDGLELILQIEALLNKAKKVDESELEMVLKARAEALETLKTIKQSQVENKDTSPLL